MKKIRYTEEQIAFAQKAAPQACQCSTPSAAPDADACRSVLEYGFCVG